MYSKLRRGSARKIDLVAACPGFSQCLELDKDQPCRCEGLSNALIENEARVQGLSTACSKTTSLPDLSPGRVSKGFETLPGEGFSLFPNECATAGSQIDAEPISSGLFQAAAK